MMHWRKKSPQTVDDNHAVSAPEMQLNVPISEDVFSTAASKGNDEL